MRRLGEAADSPVRFLVFLLLIRLLQCTSHVFFIRSLLRVSGGSRQERPNAAHWQKVQQNTVDWQLIYLDQSAPYTWRIWTGGLFNLPSKIWPLDSRVFERTEFFYLFLSERPVCFLYLLHSPFMAFWYYVDIYTVRRIIQWNEIEMHVYENISQCFRFSNGLLWKY